MEMVSLRNGKLMKWQVDEMASQQNGKLMKWQVNEMASRQNVLAPEKPPPTDVRLWLAVTKLFSPFFTLLSSKLGHSQLSLIFLGKG